MYTCTSTFFVPLQTSEIQIKNHNKLILSNSNNDIISSQLIMNHLGERNVIVVFAHTSEHINLKEREAWLGATINKRFNFHLDDATQSIKIDISHPDSDTSYLLNNDFLDYLNSSLSTVISANNIKDYNYYKNIDLSQYDSLSQLQIENKVIELEHKIKNPSSPFTILNPPTRPYTSKQIRSSLLIIIALFVNFLFSVVFISVYDLTKRAYLHYKKSINP